MGAVNVWEVESSTEFEAARGRSPQAGLQPGTGRWRSEQESCPPTRSTGSATWPGFPDSSARGSAGNVTLYQVRGLEGMTDGVYAAAAPEATIKVILQRWFNEAA